MMKFILLLCGVLLLVAIPCKCDPLQGNWLDSPKKQISVILKPNYTLDKNYYEISSTGKHSDQKRDNLFDQTCKTETATLWPQHFHDCFLEKKYADSARDLNNIIKRNLKYAKDCLNVSDKKCLLSKIGFETLMKGIIYQMKDFAETYLEEIRYERDKIVDLQCVENLDYKDFENCLYDPHVNLAANEKELKEKVENAAVCFNSQNSKCSCDAKYTLNSMMEKVFQLRNFNYPECKEPEVREKPEERKKTEAPEEPWKWYDYIVQPLKWAWNGVKSFFSNLFG